VLCTGCGTFTTVEVVREYMGGPTATSTTIKLVVKEKTKRNNNPNNIFF
jgi:hypothetical protein